MYNYDNYLARCVEDYYNAETEQEYEERKEKQSMSYDEWRDMCAEINEAQAEAHSFGYQIIERGLIMKYFKDYTKERLVEILSALCMHPANAKIVRTLQNRSFKEFMEAMKSLNQQAKA